MGSKYCKAGAVIFAKYQALIHSIQLKANQLNPKVFSTLQWNACSFSPMPVTHSLNRGLHSVSRGASMAAIDAARTTIGSAFDAANAFMRDFDQLPVIGQYPPHCLDILLLSRFLWPGCSPPPVPFTKGSLQCAHVFVCDVRVERTWLASEEVGLLSD
jgi:hypothetical protein